MQTASVTGGLIAAAVLAATIGIVSWLTFDKIYQIVEKVIESPIGKVAAAGTGIGIAAAGIAALALIFLPKK